VTKRSRGRAHLEALLSHAEQVVRVSPADILVITGLPDEQMDADQLSGLQQMLEEIGVQARGLLVLGEGQGVDSIDVESLVFQDQMAAMTPAGQPVNTRSTAQATDIGVSCPRCDQPLDLPVSGHVVDTGNGLKAFATVNQRDLGFHELLCQRRQPEGQ